MTRLPLFVLWLGLAAVTLSSSLVAQTATPPLSPTVMWRFAAQGPIFGSPVLQDGIICVGSLDSNFYAIDLATGKEKWRYATKGEIRSTACINGSSICFISGDGHLYALRKTDGRLLWKFAMVTEKKYDFADYYQSSPQMHDGMLYFGSGDGNIYALNPENGSLIWKFATGDVIHASPAFAGDKLFVGSFDGYFYALNARTGELIWRFKSVGHRFFPKGEFMGSPTVGPSLVYVGARDYNLYALDQEKGFCHWNKSFTRGWALANVVRDSIVYTGTSDDRVLIASGIRSGREFWRLDLGFNIFGGLAFDSSVGYVGTLIGKLHAVDLTGGTPLWSFATDGYQNNHLKYFKEDDSFRDDIFEIVKSNEAFVDVEYEIGAIFSTPSVFGDLIIVSSTDGTVYCLKKPTDN